MDHKYIEQLLEQYWQCETSVAEEDILRTFFSQSNVPDHLAPYVALFAAQREARADGLSEDFDERLRLHIEGEKSHRCKAVRMTLRHRLSPFLKAAAAVAIILTVGNAARRALEGNTTATDSTPSVGSPYVSSERVDAVISEARRAGDAKATALAGAATHDTLSLTPPHAQGDAQAQ